VHNDRILTQSLLCYAPLVTLRCKRRTRNDVYELWWTMKYLRPWNTTKPSCCRDATVILFAMLWYGISNSLWCGMVLILFQPKTSKLFSRKLPICWKTECLLDTLCIMTWRLFFMFYITLIVISWHYRSVICESASVISNLNFKLQLLSTKLITGCKWYRYIIVKTRHSLQVNLTLSSIDWPLKS